MPTNHKKVNKTRKVIRRGKKMSAGGSRKVNRTRKVAPRNKKVSRSRKVGGRSRKMVGRSRKVGSRSRKMGGGKWFGGKPNPNPKPQKPSKYYGPPRQGYQAQVIIGKPSEGYQAQGRQVAQKANTLTMANIRTMAQVRATKARRQSAIYASSPDRPY